MNKIVIEKNVPIPSGTGSTVYPFCEMEVGDSFHWDGEKKKLHYAASYYGKRHKKRFCCRPEGTGSRCWRTE